MGDREQRFTRIQETGGRLKVQSALNSLLWLCGLMTPAMLLAAKFITAFSMVFIVALMIAYAVTGLSYLFLLFTNPDRLQSEDYQIRKRSMEIMQQKGDLSPSYDDSVLVTGNPEYLTIDANPKGEHDA